MTTEAKTDGHVQYNGGWKFYLTFQPTLTCEFADHRTCKERSHEHDAKLAEAGSEAQVAAHAEQTARVDAAAAEALKAAQVARVNEAGQRKHEATRQNGLAKVSALAIAEQRCSITLAAALTEYNDKVEEARTSLERETGSIVIGHIAAQNGINATDYLAEVIAEEAEKALAQKTLTDANVALAKIESDKLEPEKLDDTPDTVAPESKTPATVDEEI